jgi:hypothetical protein
VGEVSSWQKSTLSEQNGCVEVRPEPSHDYFLRELLSIHVTLAWMEAEWNAFINGVGTAIPTKPSH